MNMNKKILGAIALTIVLTTVITYALISTEWRVHNHIKILGGTIELWQWQTGETYSSTYEVDDFGGMIPGTNKESPLVVLTVGSETSIKQVLSFSTTLPTSVGYVNWQVEVYFNYGAGTFGWKWFDWTNSPITYNPEAMKTMYLPGTPNNPIQPLQKIGLRPVGEPPLGSTGYLKYTIYTYPTAPCADYNFDIILTGTETP